MSADFSLSGRVAVVTGASQGLGRAIAGGLARAGADLVLAARGAERLEAVAGEVAGLGRRALAVQCDVTRSADLEAMFSEAGAEFGKVDIVVNNAGISPYYKRAERLEEHEWREVLDTNLTGAFLCLKAAAPHLFESRGVAVNVSSVAGSAGAERLAAYSAAKGGLDALTRALAIEWAPRGVRVNAIAPAFMETPMTAGIRGNQGLFENLVSKTPMGRFGQPNEVAGAVVFLASDASTYVTGQVLYIDGGWMAQ